MQSRATFFSAAIAAWCSRNSAVALEPAGGVGRGDLGPPRAVLHVDVGLQHDLQAQRVHLVDRPAHRVVVVRAVGERPDVVRVPALHVPRVEDAGPANPGPGQRAPRVGARRGGVLVVPPRHVRDAVVLEPAGLAAWRVGVGEEGLPPPPPQPPRQADDHRSRERATCAPRPRAGARSPGPQRHPPVSVRQDAGTHSTPPGPRPDGPTACPAEQAASGAQPASQPTRRETRSRSRVGSTASTVPQ